MAGWTCPDAEVIEWDGTLRATNIVQAPSVVTGNVDNVIFIDTTNLRVGINTSTPASTFDVSSTGSDFRFNHTGALSNAGMTLARAGVTKSAIYNNTDNTLRFYHGSSLVNPRMVIDNSGNVGIGINAPTAKLHLDAGNLKITGDTGSGYGYSLYVYGDSTDYFRLYQDGDKSEIRSSAAMKAIAGTYLDFGCSSGYVHFYSSTGQHMYFDAGNLFQFRDKDNSNAIVAQINSSTGEVQSGNLFPKTDDTYYVGKNDDDSPLAWKGIILKDTSDGKYYRIQVTNGAVEAIDLTD